MTLKLNSTSSNTNSIERTSRTISETIYETQKSKNRDNKFDYPVQNIGMMNLHLGLDSIQQSTMNQLLSQAQNLSSRTITKKEILENFLLQRMKKKASIYKTRKSLKLKLSITSRVSQYFFLFFNQCQTDIKPTSNRSNQVDIRLNQKSWNTPSQPTCTLIMF